MSDAPGRNDSRAGPSRRQFLKGSGVTAATAALVGTAEAVVQAATADENKDKTESMQARASAMDELIESGDLQELGSNTTQLDRELQQVASQQQVDAELEKLKAEVGSGAPQKELEGSQSQSQPEQQPGG